MFNVQALAINELKDRFFCQVNSTLVEVAALHNTSWLVRIPFLEICKLLEELMFWYIVTGTTLQCLSSYVVESLYYILYISCITEHSMLSCILNSITVCCPMHDVFSFSVVLQVC